MMNEYVYEHYHKFDNDCDDLYKKCSSLKTDLIRLKKSLNDDIVLLNGKIPTNSTYFHVNNLKAKLPIFKVKKFRCQSINRGNRSKFRIIFAYNQSESLIYFIEIYYKKNDKTEMNRKRAIEACEFICNP